MRHDVADRDALGAPVHEPPKALGTRATIACALLGLTIPVELWVIVTDLGYLDVVNQILDGQLVTQSEIDDADDAVTASSIVQVAAIIGTAVGFLFWFARAYYNLPRLSLGGLRFGRGWSIGSWFVPILNFFRPKAIANDIWRGSEAAAETTGRIGAWKSRPVGPLLHWWWGLWIIVTVLSQVASRLFIDEGDAFTRAQALDALRDERIGYWLDIGASAIMIAAAVLAVLVVRRITALQGEAMARTGATGS